MDIVLDCRCLPLRSLLEETGGRTMRYLHTLDPDELRMMSEQDRRDLEDYERAAELAREDAVMEKYYEEKHNS